MAGKGLDVNCQGCRQPTKALWPDAYAVHPLQDVGLQFTHLGIRAGLSHLTQQGMLGQPHGLFGRAADANADDDGRAGIRSCPSDRFNHKVDDSFSTIGWLEHPELAHIFATTALGGHDDSCLVAGHNGGVDNRWGVVLGVDAAGEGMVDDGLAQIAVLIALPDSLGDGLVQVAAGDMDILPQFDKDHRQAAILAQGHLLLAGDLGVFQDLIQHFLPDRRSLFLTIAVQGCQDIVAQVVVAFYAKAGYRFGDQVRVNISHVSILTWSLPGTKKAPQSV